MLNEKMQKLANSIGGVIWHTYPQNYLGYIFSGKISDYEVVLQVLFECCKYAFDNYSGPANEHLSSHSLRYYLPKIDEYQLTDTENADRLVAQRTLERINKWREKAYHYYDDLGIPAPDSLVPSDMRDQKSRFAGYEITPFQFWEINDYHDTKLESDIVKQSLAKKNYTYEQFIERVEDYDKRIESYCEQSKDNDVNMVFSTLKAFVLEWKYRVSFFYQIADAMEKNKLNSIEDVDSKLSLFCGLVQIHSELSVLAPSIGTHSITTESRLLRLRTYYIQEILNETFDDSFHSVFHTYRETIYLISDLLLNMTYQELPLREWFCHNTTIEDWASVFREYDIFHFIELNKDLSRKTVKNMKYLLASSVVQF